MADIEPLRTTLADRYLLERELGSGGMATVYLARDLKHDREVALKVLRPDLAAILGRERFLNEVRLTARLDHPHIVTLIDSGESGGLLWYVLPFIRGESLRHRIHRERQMGLDEALAITRQVAGALDYAHQHGVIHRDIKPENIMLHEGEAMLTDFGIALAVSEAGGTRITESGLSLGTPAYMSPEQATGDRALDARSDVYSLAAVLYEMLAGEPPHTGATAQALIARLITERPTPLRVIRDTVPGAVDAAVAKALAKVPADRFASAGQLAAALTAAPRVTAPAGRPRWLRQAAAGLGVLVAVALAVGVARLRPHAPGAPIKLTTSGDILAAALAPDATHFAKTVRECDSTGRCLFGVVRQDLGTSGELRLADRFGSVSALEWSPDARQVLVYGTDSTGRFGAFRVGALGGPVQFLGCCGTHFLTTGDTVLQAGRDTAGAWRLRVITTADGLVRDGPSPGTPGQAVLATPAPNGKLIAEIVQKGDSSTLVIVDRRWARLDSIILPRRYRSPFWDPRGDGVYLLETFSSKSTALYSLERVSVNSRGQLGSPSTIQGLAIPELESLAIVGPSRTLLYVEGGQETSVTALTRDRAPSLDFESRVLRRSTGELGAYVSPDGRFLNVWTKPDHPGRLELTIVPFEGGQGTPIPASEGPIVGFHWSWNSLLRYTVRDATGRLTLYTFDPASGRARLVGPFPPRAGLVPVGEDQLAWIDDSAGTVVVGDTNGVERRRFAYPDFERNLWLKGSPDGRSVLTMQWSVDYDSLLFTTFAVADGEQRRIAGLLADHFGGDVHWEADGSIQVPLMETLGSLAFYQLDSDGKHDPVRLGSHPVEGLLYYTFSRDGRRAVRVDMRRRGDAWMISNFDGRGQEAAR